MAALCPNLTTALPFLPVLRPHRRLSPAASVGRPRGPRVVLRGSRHPDLPARNSVWFENATRLRTEHKKKVLFASETDSPNTDGSKRSDETSSPPDGPPVLTILAGIIVFFLVLWVIGSIFTWIVGLVFGAVKNLKTSALG